ncbi:MAG: hypothetical protein KAR44_04585 [Candidatus Aegiribacteria sp.]|nr:hypothetical protein [Candidatus Aegiribacteria sp.]
MKTILLGSVLTAVLMITSCLNEESTESLLDSMPAGHDFYLTFNPEEADIEELLLILSDSLNSDDIRIREIEEILGFFPLEWSGWVDALALRHGSDIGLTVDRHRDDIAVLNLILPSEDPVEVERFFTGISNRIEEFDSRLSFTESEGCTIVTISQSAEEHSLFVLDSGIRNYGDYIRLRGSAAIHDAALMLYAKPDDFLDTEGIGSILFICTVDNSILRLTLDISFESDDVMTFTSMLAPSPNSGDIFIPSDVTGMLRISLNMQSVKDFLYSQGIDREFEPGIEDFGFSSFEEFIDSFSGDLYFGFELTEYSHAGFLQFGIRDPEAIDRMLYFIYTAVAGFSDPGMTTFDLDSHRCYRVSGNPSMGIDSIEFGIINDMVIISGDFTLKDIAGGISFSDLIRRNGLGMDNETSVLLTSETEPFSVNRDLPMEMRKTADLSSITRFAASADVDGNIISVTAALEFSEGDPIQRIFQTVVSSGGDYTF